MNDRFKFRVWDKEQNRYTGFLDTITQDGQGSYHYGCENCQIIMGKKETEKYIIEQCTGVKDINGTLIYEGDLLQDNCGTIYEVGWDDGGYWSILDYQSQECEFLRYPSNCKIIGNIHNKGDVK